MCQRCGEAERGCGFRKIGGFYLEGTGLGVPCGRLPIPIAPCGQCGQRPKFTRGLQRIDPRAILQAADSKCWMAGEVLFRTATESTAAAHRVCPFNGDDDPAVPAAVGLMWVGAAHYTPGTFVEEAIRHGISKRVPRPPAWLKPGETWIYLAHEAAIVTACRLGAHGEPIARGLGSHPADCPDCGADGMRRQPGVFFAFRPTRVVKIVGDDAPEAELAALREKGVEPVVVDRTDPRHQPGRAAKEAPLPMEVPAGV